MGSGVKRMNLGCGSIQPDGWVNVDKEEHGQEYKWDIAKVYAPRVIRRAGGVMIYKERVPTPGFDACSFDYIVANHLLSCFSHHELRDTVLPNILRLLKPGGVLRVLVPDARKAAHAYLDNDPAWFPLGDDLPDISDRFCTFLPWFGESKSIFDVTYLFGLGIDAGFVAWRECGFKVTKLCDDPEIVSLDDREAQSLIVEFQK